MQLLSIIKRLNPFGLVEVVTRGINWSILPVAGLFVSPDVFGQMVLIYTTVFIITSVATFGQQKAVLQYSEQNKSQSYTVFWIATGLSVGIGLLVFMALDWLQGDVLWGIAIVGVLMAIHQIASSQARSFTQIFSFSRYRVVLVIVRGLAIFIVIAVGFTPWRFLIAEIFAVSIALLVNTSDLTSKMRYKRKTPLAPLVRNAFQVGLPLSFQTITLMITLHYDKFVIGNRSLTELGQYGYLFMICSSLTFLIAYLNIKFDYAILQSKDMSESFSLTQAYLKRLSGVFALFFPITVLVYWISALINAANGFLLFPFVLVFLGQYLYGVVQCVSHFAIRAAQFKIIGFLAFLSAVVSLAGNSIFTTQYGIISAACVFLLSNALSAVGLVFTTLRVKSKTFQQVAHTL